MSTGVVDDAEGKFWNQPDLLAFARAQPLASLPGETFAYSDLAVQLLSGIVSSAATEGIDQYLKTRLFDPLSITDSTWDPDATGNMQISGGLFMSPHDLARIGWFALKGGKWKNRTLLSSSWFAESASPSAANGCYGLLWWLVRSGCGTGSLAAPDPASLGPVAGVHALGWGGQYIVVNAAANLVAIRTLDVAKPGFKVSEANFLADFPDKVEALTR